MLKLSALPMVSPRCNLPLVSSKVRNGSKCIHIFNCLAEVPSKTATGTIAIQVEDFNDHCPTLTSTTHTMCYEDNFIYVTAIDRDLFPNAAPFEFTVVEGTSWNVEPFNGKIIAFSAHFSSSPPNQGLILTSAFVSFFNRHFLCAGFDKKVCTVQSVLH